MKISTTDPESIFLNLSGGLNTFVMNTLEQYEQDKKTLIEALKQEKEKNAKLTKELENKESSENKCK